MVEAAFIMLLLLMILLGTVTSAIAYSRFTSLQTAARESSRFGATLPVDGDLDAWLTQVLDVARAAGSGDLGAGVPGQNICVAYVYPDGAAAHDQTTMLVESLGVTGTPQSGASCFDDGRPDDERRVQVATGRETTLQMVVWSVDIDLESTSAARFEREGS